MIVLETLYIIIAGILIFFLVFPFLTVFISFFFKERIKTPKDFGSKYQQFDYGCIITAYKNADIAKPLIASLLKQSHSNLHIYLVADECDVSNFNLSDPRLTVFRPDPPLRLKAKSIIHAMDHFVRSHDYTVVFDADNLAHPEFLAIINKYANNGHQAIQGQRTAKNLDTTMACADATGEFYKNYIDRYVPYLLRSSSVISGSGMAVETKLYRSYLDSPEIEQGKHLWKKMLQEDKILQNVLLAKGERITYAWDAIVYDEKVVSGEQVETQRSRWLYSYFQNLPNSSGHILKGLLQFSFNRFFFGWITIAPPLFILLFSAAFVAGLGLFINLPVALTLMGAIIIFIGNIFLVLWLSKVPQPIWSAIGSIPFFVWKQFRGLMKMGNPNKNFKHSEHSRNVSIEDVLKED